MKCLAIAALAAIIPIAHVDVGPRSEIFITGQTSCEVWKANRTATDGRSRESAADYLLWILGFEAAMAILSRNIDQGFQRTDSNGVALWVDNFCLTHPGEDISAAAFRLAVALGDINNVPESESR